MVVGQRQLRGVERPGDRQASGRIGVAEQRLREGEAAGFARIPGVDDGVGVVDPTAHRHRAAADENDDRRFSGRVHRADQRFLIAGQVQARAVAEFAFVNAGDDDDRIRIAGEFARLRPPRFAVVPCAGVPEQAHTGAAAAHFAEFDHDRPTAAIGEVDVDEIAMERRLVPAIDDELAVEIQTKTVVAFEAEAIAPCGRSEQFAAPAHRIIIRRELGVGRTEHPAEVDRRIDALRDRRAGKIGGVEKAGLQSRRIVVAQVRGVDGREFVGVARAALSVDDLRRLARALLQAVENADRLDALAAVAAQARLRGVLAENEQGFRMRERQNAVAVLQQHERPQRSLARQLAMRAVLQRAPRRGGIDVGMIEQAQFEFRAQHARHGVVDARSRDRAVEKRRHEQRGLRDVGLEDDIESGADGHRRRLRVVARGVVQHVRAADRARVGDDEAAEFPLVFQRLCEQPRIRARRRAVDAVVRSHQRARMRDIDRRLERREMHFFEPARAFLDRITVAAAVADVGDEMLGCGDHVLVFDGFHEGRAEHSRQIRIFAVGFLDAAPAHVVGDVDHRPEDIAQAARFRLDRDRLADRAEQLRIEARGEADRLRKRRGVVAHEPVQRLVERQHRNAEPRFVDEKVLRGVDLARQRFGVLARVVAQDLLRGAALRVGAELQAEDAVAELVAVGRRHLAGHHEQLPELFLGRHAREQVGDARLDACFGVFINRRVLDVGGIAEHRRDRHGGEQRRGTAAHRHRETHAPRRRLYSTS